MLDKLKNQLAEDGQIVINVKVRPGSAKSEIKEIMADDTLKINLKSPPIKGQANKDLIKLLSREFGGEVDVIRGEKARGKVVRIKKTQKHMG